MRYGNHSNPTTNNIILSDYIYENNELEWKDEFAEGYNSTILEWYIPCSRLVETIIAVDAK